MEKFFLVFQELVIKVSKDLLLLYLFFPLHSENGVLIFILNQIKVLWKVTKSALKGTYQKRANLESVRGKYTKHSQGPKIMSQSILVS